MTTVHLEASTTQSTSGSFTEVGLAPNGIVAMLALGLISGGIAPTQTVVSFPSANEATFITGSVTRQLNFSAVIEVLAKVHQVLTVESSDLDADARRVLADNRWDLYLS